jgi:hypothetical protein
VMAQDMWVQLHVVSFVVLNERVSYRVLGYGRLPAQALASNSPIAFGSMARGFQ